MWLPYAGVAPAASTPACPRMPLFSCFAKRRPRRPRLPQVAPGWDDLYAYKGGSGKGRGKFVYGLGFDYEGDWADEKYHGHGRYASSSGTVYLGQWQK